MSDARTCTTCKYSGFGIRADPCRSCIKDCQNGEDSPYWEPRDEGSNIKQEPLGHTGFVRDAHAGKGRMDLLPWIGIMEVSKLCEEGALHYGERNIDKGAPLHSLLDSGARHLAKVMSGYTDEDHLRAACWNLLWALQERTTHPELNDTPWPWYEKEDGQE